MLNLPPYSQKFPAFEVWFKTSFFHNQCFLLGGVTGKLAQLLERCFSLWHHFILNYFCSILNIIFFNDIGFLNTRDYNRVEVPFFSNFSFSKWLVPFSSPSHLTEDITFHIWLRIRIIDSKFIFRIVFFHLLVFDQLNWQIVSFVCWWSSKSCMGILNNCKIKLPEINR